jgi:hypothetical protein
LRSSGNVWLFAIDAGIVGHDRRIVDRNDPMAVNEQFDLIDRRGRRLGRVAVTGRDGDIIQGVISGVDLAGHGELFVAWQSAVDE